MEGRLRDIRTIEEPSGEARGGNLKAQVWMGEEKVMVGENRLGGVKLVQMGRKTRKRVRRYLKAAQCRLLAIAMVGRWRVQADGHEQREREARLRVRTECVASLLECMGGWADEVVVRRVWNRLVQNFDNWKGEPCLTLVSILFIFEQPLQR